MPRNNSNGISIKQLLETIGVGSDMQSLGDLAEDVKKYSYIATCDSEECSRKNRSRIVVKNVPKTTTFCKDCGGALFWKRK